jgi:hypothetical protein
MRPSLRALGFRQRVAPAATVLILASAIVPLALAKVVRNTIDPVATVSDQGRHLVVTGPIECDAGQTAHVKATVTQRETGAVAEGSTRIHCTGASQQWEVHAVTVSRERFEEGVATAVGLARTADRGATDDVHQWLVEITLVRE